MAARADHAGGSLPGEEDGLLSGKGNGGRRSPPAAKLAAVAAVDDAKDDGAFACSQRHALGALLLVVVSVIWTGASMLVQYIMVTLKFERPFFLTYVSNGLFSILLLMELCRARLGASGAAKWLVHPGDASWRQEGRAAMFVSVVWFAAQETYNASLGGTTVSVSTILSATSSVFTLFQSFLFLREPFSWAVALGVAVCIGGAVTAALASQRAGQGETTWLGVTLALVSAALYGSYTVLIRKAAPVEPEREREFNLRVLFGFIGLFNLVLLAPVVTVLHATGAEDLSALTPYIFGLIVVKGLIDNVLSDLLWAQAILLTSPTVATIGLSLTVPMAMLADLITPGIVPSWAMILGGTLVTSGFVIANLANTPPAPKDDDDKEASEPGTLTPAAGREQALDDSAPRPGPSRSPLSEDELGA